MAEEARDGYTVSKWHDLDKFDCSDCSFDSLDEAVIKEHRRLRHPRPRRTTPLRQPIVGARGETITERDSTPEEIEKAGQKSKSIKGPGPERASTDGPQRRS